MTITHRIPGLVLTDHQFEVPLDYADPDGQTIMAFAREVVAPARENDDLPWLVFLQGGPGYASPRLQDRSGWLKRALDDYRVLLLDQRGTGRSTPVLPQTLAGFPSPAGPRSAWCCWPTSSQPRPRDSTSRRVAAG